MSRHNNHLQDHFGGLDGRAALNLPSEILSFGLGVAVGIGVIYSYQNVKVERHPLDGRAEIPRELTIGPDTRVDIRNEPRR